MSNDQQTNDRGNEILLLLLLPVIVVASLWIASRPSKDWLPLKGEAFAALLTGEILVASLVVAQWYQNLARSREIALFQRLAFTYRLGETLALRPFLAKS